MRLKATRTIQINIKLEHCIDKQQNNYNANRNKLTFCLALIH